MGFREKLIYRLVKWERTLEEKKEIWRDLKTRDKVIIIGLISVGAGQIIVGLALMFGA